MPFTEVVAISIRTPAWGVTGDDYFYGTDVLISIRTPAWGVKISYKIVAEDKGFQFAPPRGG